MTIEVDYIFPPEVDAEKQGQIIAVGQTAGTWGANFAHREKFLHSHLGKVVKGVTNPEGDSIVTVAFPEANVEGDIPSLLTMIFGKYSMAGTAKVSAVRLPENYGLRPKFGIKGIREILGVGVRPPLMGIFKPALGLSTEDYASILREVANAGLDIIKDDEIMGNLEEAPTLIRLHVCRQVLEEVKEKTGRTVLYAINVTSKLGKCSNPLDTAKLLVREGANALLLNVLSYGFSVLESLAADPEINVPIFAHPALAGAICAAPNYGIAYPVVLGTLMAHAGADAVLYPASYGSLGFDPIEEGKIRDILRSRDVFPVPAAGIKPSVVPQVLRDYGQDVILMAGTGIMDYPNGREAGVKAFFQALALESEVRQ
ncbi:MAG: 2,3-diketo-5-methylthiopentyl-1-phosphate enolase [Okeania sp. SIO2F4]|uniref:RuBisCO large subunit C-terminal-like domain-containing protein n=1 Tax=Okeania sp. SIO2F4 TaxID=2607790 RepID=UPI00142B2FE2|nr:RuBisCO large subunit C-terminal-like domain-containing protein [Okeania sp. SIO2F4]NES04040.1 2,3-diketo-5-methylthiopentyl-1-phosphate enolase [Okeania sp. SIO2F4]